ncbi:hypothetical protein A4A49_48523 [Nicotiana attenuata]|uniref:Uncharacterized protein n=1 Tax=Nicotiana attenuata TaxID=49451 RepID=A0A314L5F7_NICAT|nr:hypothetical protein A4A49_48523 [Nicotiana attenuata]
MKAVSPYGIRNAKISPSKARRGKKELYMLRLIRPISHKIWKGIRLKFLDLRCCHIAIFQVQRAQILQRLQILQSIIGDTRV